MLRKTPRPTEGELAILRVLWAHGPATVRQVNAQLNEQTEARETSYTTTLKLMQIMAAKKLVVRDESERTHIYRAALAPGETQTQLVSDLVHRAFGGSATTLVMQALSAHPPTPEELTEIKKLITGFQARHQAPSKLANKTPNPTANQALRQSKTGSSK